jgi:predicted  nucleic acid-binding Zn-ribbon protein
MALVDEQRQRLKSLEADKERMIREYMSLQDEADELNGRIYRICCGVESLNAQILALQEEIRIAALKPAPANGKAAHPPVGGKPR